MAKFKVSKKAAAKMTKRREALKKTPLASFKGNLKTSWGTSNATRVSFFGHKSHRISSKMG